MPDDSVTERMTLASVCNSAILTTPSARSASWCSASCKPSASAPRSSGARRSSIGSWQTTRLAEDPVSQPAAEKLVYRVMAEDLVKLGHDLHQHSLPAGPMLGAFPVDRTVTFRTPAEHKG
jgi:hypothetical protein